VKCTGFFLIIGICLLACKPEPVALRQQSLPVTDSLSGALPVQPSKDSSRLERYFAARGLVNIASLDSSIRVALHYASDQNFLHKSMYDDLDQCYLPCEVAIRLCNAQYFLKQDYPGYGIVVFDAVRPLHIQQQMWDELDMPPAQKVNYLAHPSQLSLHNYGAAVDVGVISREHVLVDMGSAFDCFDSISEPKWEAHFLKTGRLSQQAYANRLILRNVMRRAGFSTIPSEWWHFNATDKATAALKYTLIE